MFWFNLLEELTKSPLISTIVTGIISLLSVYIGFRLAERRAEQRRLRSRDAVAAHLLFEVHRIRNLAGTTRTDIDQGEFNVTYKRVPTNAYKSHCEKLSDLFDPDTVMDIEKFYAVSGNFETVMGRRRQLEDEIAPGGVPRALKKTEEKQKDRLTEQLRSYTQPVLDAAQDAEKSLSKIASPAGKKAIERLREIAPVKKTS